MRKKTYKRIKSSACPDSLVVRNCPVKRISQVGSILVQVFCQTLLKKTLSHHLPFYIETGSARCYFGGRKDVIVSIIVFVSGGAIHIVELLEKKWYHLLTKTTETHCTGAGNGHYSQAAGATCMNECVRQWPFCSLEDKAQGKEKACLSSCSLTAL